MNIVPAQPQSDAPLASAFRIGVAGWAYPDWRGIVYDRSGGELDRIAGLFQCVEINTTFYRYPEPRLAEGWLKATAARPASFCFTAKVPRDLTHEEAAPAADLRSGGKRLIEGLRPLLEAGRLQVLLAQFPPWLEDGNAARGRIGAIVEALLPAPVAVEVRHDSFLKKGGDFLPFLESLGAGFVNADLPAGRRQPPPTTINTASWSYVRLHGRNGAAWFDRRAGRDEKYNYLYSAEELREWVPRLRELAARTLKVYVIANNHYKGQAPANALQLLALLGLEVPPIPPGLLALYPGLRELGGATGAPATRAAADLVGGTGAP